MKIYLIPQEIRRNQPDRFSSKRINWMAEKIKGRDIKRVYGCEYNAEAAKALAKKLDVPVSIDARLKPFNLGRHNRKNGKEYVALEAMLQKALERNDWSIPVSGGDSWVSYRRRMWKAFVEGIINTKEPQDSAVLVDMRGIQTLHEMVEKKFDQTALNPKAAILGTRALDYDRIYVVRTA